MTRTNTADSPVQAAAAASRALYKQEDYLRSLSGLSDDSLREQMMKQTVCLQKAAVKEWLDSGDCYFVSLAGKVHLPTCQSMGRFIDRDAAWGVNLRFPDRLLARRDEDAIPVWPILRTRAQIESMDHRPTCPLCPLDLAFPDKPKRAMT